MIHLSFLNLALAAASHDATEDKEYGGGYPLFSLFHLLCFYVRFFQSDAFFLIYNLQHEAQYKSSHAEAGQHDERCGVVKLRGVGNAGVGGVEHLADKQGEQPQTDVLNPEYQGVGRAYDLLVDELGHRGP